MDTVDVEPNISPSGADVELTRYGGSSPLPRIDVEGLRDASETKVARCLRKIFAGTATPEERLYYSRYVATVKVQERKKRKRKAHKDDNEKRFTSLVRRWTIYRHIYNTTRKGRYKGMWRWTQQEFIEYHKRTLVMVEFDRWVKTPSGIRWSIYKPKTRYVKFNERTVKFFTLEEMLLERMPFQFKLIDWDKGYSIGNMEVVVGGTVVYSDREKGGPPLDFTVKKRKPTKIIGTHAKEASRRWREKQRAKLRDP